MDTEKRMDKNDNEVWENLLCFFHSSNFLVQLCWRVTADILDWCVNNDFLHDEVQYSTDKQITDGNNQNDGPGRDR